MPNTPIFRSYVVLTRIECVLFVDGRKIPSEVEESLGRDGVVVKPYGVEQVKEYVVEWKKTEQGRGCKVIAPPSVSWGLVHQIKMAISVRICNCVCVRVRSDSCLVQEKIDITPCLVEAAKAIKNETEIQGFRNAYLRDGAATVSTSATSEQDARSR